MFEFLKKYIDFMWRGSKFYAKKFLFICNRLYSFFSHTLFSTDSRYRKVLVVFKRKYICSDDFFFKNILVIFWLIVWLIIFLMCSSPRPQYPLFAGVWFLAIRFFFEDFHRFIVPFSPNGESLTLLYFLASFVVLPLAIILFLMSRIRIKFHEPTKEFILCLKPFTVSEMLRNLLPLIIGFPLVTEITFCPEFSGLPPSWFWEREMTVEEKWISDHWEKLLKKKIFVLDETLDSNCSIWRCTQK